MRKKFPTNTLTLSPSQPAATKTTLAGLSPGPAGTRQTLHLMRNYVREFKKNIYIRELAMSLVRNESPKNYPAEAARLYEFVRDQIRYVRDINGVETIATPIKTLEYEQGDCDDKVVLLAALLESIGHPSRFRALGFNNRGFSHVILDTKIGHRWIPMETTEPVQIGWTPPNPTICMIVDNH